MTEDNGWFENLVELLGEQFDFSVLSDDEVQRIIKEQLIHGARILGAGLLGEKIDLSASEQKILYKIGQFARTRLNGLQNDREKRRKQRENITRCSLLKIKTLGKLQKMAPEDFEYWVAGYFERHGFTNVLVTQYSGDFGIDIYMTCPNRVKAVVQVKRFTGSVGRPVIQQTYGAMRLVNARKCYVVTSGHFAKTAQELEMQRKDIILIDGKKLLEKK